MKNVFNIICELKATNSKNEKIKILEKNKSNEELKLVLETTYSKTLNFFVRKFKVENFQHKGLNSLTYSIKLLIENISTRKYSGDDAKSYLRQLVQTCEDPSTLLKVINRDLDCGIQVGLINKVWKNLINKPPYMSYKLFDPSQVKKMKLPVISGVKLDGLFADIKVYPSEVVLSSRDGKVLDIPLTDSLKADLFKIRESVGENIVLNGEAMVISNDADNLEGYAPRAIGNGYLNQDADKIDPNIVHLIVWDVLTENDYLSRKSNTPYKERLGVLTQNSSLLESGQLIINEFVRCETYQEAIDHFIVVRKRRLEGTVVKEEDLKWKDGKLSSGGWKLKNEFVSDYLVTATYPHKKNPDLIGGLTVQSSDGKLISDVGSGLTDELRAKPSEYFVGKIVAIKANDLTYVEGRDTVSLFLPRLIEIRDDKAEADDFDKIQSELNSYVDLIKEAINKEEN